MPPSVPTVDLIIRDALLIDGSGTAGVRGDLAVKDDRIVAIGDLSQTERRRAKSPAKGLALAPGFVDTHTHDDRALLCDPLMECKISQGVTTVDHRQLRHQPRAAVDRPLPAAAARHHRRASRSNSSRPSTAISRRSTAIRRRSTRRARSATPRLRVGAMDRFDRAATPTEIDAMRRTLETVAGARRHRHVDRALLSAGEGCADR